MAGSWSYLGLTVTPDVYAKNTKNKQGERGIPESQWDKCQKYSMQEKSIFVIIFSACSASIIQLSGKQGVGEGAHGRGWG